MGKAISLVYCLFLILTTELVFFAWAAEAAASPEPQISIQPDGSLLAETSAYSAKIGTDGNLHSFRVSGQEMIDDSVAISLGAFLYANEPRRLNSVNRSGPAAITATDGTYTIEYQCMSNEIQAILKNASTKPVTYFVVFSPQIAIVSNPRTGETEAAPASVNWGEVKASAVSGAYLHLSGGTRIWGPWLDRQVWELSRLAPGETAKIVLRGGVGKALSLSPAQMLGLRVKVNAPDSLIADGEAVDLTVSVENRSDQEMTGTISVELTACRSDYVVYLTSTIALPAKKVSDANFKLKVKAPDFYTARVALSVAGREVTKANAVAGYRVEEIRAEIQPPPDFGEFWLRLLNEVGESPSESHLEPSPTHSQGDVEVSVVRYLSVGDKLIHGWYLHHKETGPRPAILYLSGYGAPPTEPPISLTNQGYTVLAIDVWGNEVDKSRPHAYENYFTTGIGNPNTYVYREKIGHVLRGIKFLAAQQETDPQHIALVGVSEGGGLALIAAGLSSQIAAVSADAPLLCDFPLSIRSADWPFTEIANYLQRQPDEADQVFHALAYYDVANFAPAIKCPVLLSVGLLDRVTLPSAVYGVFNRLSSPKEIRPLPEAGHEGGGRELWAYKFNWLSKILSLSSSPPSNPSDSLGTGPEEGEPVP